MQPSKNSLTTPVARILLSELVTEKIPDIAVADRLREFWDAETTASDYDPNTKTTVEVKKPNYDVRKYAMDKRLALGGYRNGELPENQQASVVTNIQFTTINNNLKEEVIDVKSE